MNFKPLFALFLILLIVSCKQEKQHLTRIEGKQIPVSDSLATDTEIEAFIKPYRDHLNKDMDSVISYSMNTYSKSDGVANNTIHVFVISYSMNTYSKSDGELNTAIGNLFAD